MLKKLRPAVGSINHISQTNSSYTHTQRIHKSQHHYDCLHLQGESTVVNMLLFFVTLVME